MATATTEKREEKREHGNGNKNQSSELQRSSGTSRSAAIARPPTSTGSPFAMMRRMFEDMDRLFSDFGVGRDDFGLDLTRSIPQGLWSPQIEVREKEGKLVVHADLPGLKPEDIQVNIEEGVLTISGERKNESENEEGGVYRCERSYGRFERRIGLPRGVDPNAIDAKFDNGVLELSAPLPKEEPRGRRIEIKGSSEARDLGSRDVKKH